jgi:hypothetical protein
MIIEIAFIFTTAMIILAALKIVPAMWGSDITLPHLIPWTRLTPTHYLIMYPSVIFQVWFWVNRLGVFSL